jgi:hypothetical protein
MGQTCNHDAFEVLVMKHSLVIIGQMVSKQRQRQLGRSAAAIAPLKPARTVTPQVEAGNERATVNSD